ncbi:MAG: MAPEG family protein [Alphaproteobacteria bacterium]
MTGFAVPITTLYAGLNALLLIALAFWVVRMRQATQTVLGTTPSHTDNPGLDDRLERACRAHGNAVEYIPVALILILVLELMGQSVYLLHGLGLGLTVGRILHAQGLATSRGATPGRLAGTAMTWGVFIIGGLAAIVTAFQAVWVPGPQ